MPFSRLRLVADQFKLSATPGDVGAAVFEMGTVLGVSGLILKKTRIGDLQVKTLHLKNESVTIPAYTQLASNAQFTTVNTWLTFAEQNIVTKGAAGSSIFILLLQQGSITMVSGGGNVLIRALLNDAEALTQALAASFGGAGGPTEFQRLSMGSVPATGATQTLNIKWQVQDNTGISSATFRVNAGSRVMAVAMKR